MASESFDTAAEMFQSIPGYKDADDLYVQCVYSHALACMESQEYDKAIELLNLIPDYSDVERQLRLANYGRAEKLMEDGELEEAAAAFDALGSLLRRSGARNEARYAYAQEAFVTACMALPPSGLTRWATTQTPPHA